MENLGDILKRLGTTKSPPGTVPQHRVSEDPEGAPESCQVCGGRGWFSPDAPIGDPKFGQVVTCQCQQERLREERVARLLRYSNLGYLSRFTFETLAPNGLADDAESQRLFNDAYQAAVKCAEDPMGWLVFTGPNGSGKTHLAAAIANHRIENGHPAFFVHVPDLLDHLRSSFGPTSDVSYSDLFEQVKNTPLLILDGLGSQSTTLWAHEKLQQIINHRFNGQLPTVITTSSDPDELDPYIRSRLQSTGMGRVIKIGAREPGPVQLLGRIEPEMERRMTFERFDVRGNNASASERASLEGAYQAAKNFAADPDGWLTLFGETGVGKTHLAIAIAVERMTKGQPAFFAFVLELLDYLRYTFTPESRITYDQVFDEIKNTPLLILDDLARENNSPWAEEKLYQIVVHRHNARLPTVITSTLEFTEQTGPISSRVRDPLVGQLVRIDAPDYRIKDKGGQRARRREGRRGTAR